MSSKTLREDHIESGSTTQLCNSKILKELNAYLSHLVHEEMADAASLLNEFKCLFWCSLWDKCVRTRHWRGLCKSHKTAHLQSKPAEARSGVHDDTWNSSWSSPWILVPKADTTSPRFCSDFRKLNCVTKPDSYPLPRVDDCVDRLGSARFVSKFDLLKGYWQVPLTQRAKELSAFVTPDGLFQYRRMPFGLSNTGATFQHLMHMVLRGLDNTEVYSDVFSDSWPDHLKHVREVLGSKRLTWL